jgi:hypothetical protein
MFQYTGGNEGLIFQGKMVKIKTCFTIKNKKTHSVEVYANLDVSMDERKWI